MASMTSFKASVCTGIQRGTPPRASQLIDWAQQGETGQCKIGVARKPPLEHAFGQLLRHLAHNNRRSRVERRSTALVVVAVIVTLDERLDLAFEITGQEVVFQEDAVLKGLVPALDLALGLRVERRAAHMAHALGFNVIGQFASDVAGADRKSVV